MNVIKRLVSKFGGRSDKPALPNYKLTEGSSVARYYDIDAVAAQLSSKTPFFKMATGTYAVQTKKVQKKDDSGKLVTVEVPTNFIRLGKARNLKGKARKKARIADRLRILTRLSQMEAKANG